MSALAALVALQKAKENVHWLVDHENGLVDMHGLSYWAGEVDRLRAEVRESL